MGLAISKSLVEAMGGSIGVLSRLGKGATFWFEIPCPVTSEPMPQGNPSAPKHTELRGLRVLMADDNAMNRELLRLMLTPLGVELTEAADGQAAIDHANASPFDLILLDVRMPGMDGAQVARAIRTGGSLNDAIPILAFTADASGTMAAADVFDDCISKPMIAADLTATLARWASIDCSTDEPQSIYA